MPVTPAWLTRRRIVVAGAVLAVVALALLATRDPPLEVEVAQAAVRPLEVAVEEDGRTRAVDRYVVTAPVAGRMERIELREGTHLAAGDVVATIEPLPLAVPERSQLQAQLAGAGARLRSAEAALQQAESAAQQAARELERRRPLAEDGILTTEQLEQFALAARLRAEERDGAQAAVGAAAAEVEGARAALLGTGAQGAAVVVTAPGAGVVLRVPERSARVVAPGEPLLEVGDPGALEVVVDVLTSEAVRVAPGMPAFLTGWGGDTLAARVRRVEPSGFTRVSALGVEEQRVNVILDLDHRPHELGDAYRVDARIVVWSDAAALTVPAAALFRTEAGWRLFAVEDGRAVPRDVAVGERGDALAQILSGVEAGEEVVIFPPDGLEAGTRVRAAGG